MKISRSSTNPKSSTLKLKLILCWVGVAICMAILATIPPVKQNSLLKIKSLGKASTIAKSNQGQSVDQVYTVQTATTTSQTSSAAQQGSNSSLQGQASQAAASASALANQSPSSTEPVINLPGAPLPQPCGACGGTHTMCPLSAVSCSRCGGPIDYACLVEE